MDEIFLECIQTHCEHLENQLHSLDSTWKSIRHDLTAHAWRLFWELLSLLWNAIDWALLIVWEEEISCICVWFPPAGLSPFILQDLALKSQNHFWNTVDEIKENMTPNSAEAVIDRWQSKRWKRPVGIVATDLTMSYQQLFDSWIQWNRKVQWPSLLG